MNQCFDPLQKAYIQHIRKANREANLKAQRTAVNANRQPPVIPSPLEDGVFPQTNASTASASRSLVQETEVCHDFCQSVGLSQHASAIDPTLLAYSPPFQVRGAAQAALNLDRKIAETLSLAQAYAPVDMCSDTQERILLKAGDSSAKSSLESQSSENDQLSSGMQPLVSRPNSPSSSIPGIDMRSSPRSSANPHMVPSPNLVQAELGGRAKTSKKRSLEKDDETEDEYEPVAKKTKRRAITKAKPKTAASKPLATKHVFHEAASEDQSTNSISGVPYHDSDFPSGRDTSGFIPFGTSGRASVAQGNTWPIDAALRGKIVYAEYDSDKLRPEEDRLSYQQILNKYPAWRIPNPSTLRGANRKLLKPDPAERKRKPEWSVEDVAALRKAVVKPSVKDRDGNIAWNKVRDSIEEETGNVFWGGACNRKWQELKAKK